MNYTCAFILLAILFFRFSAEAQPYVSDLGRFEVDQIKGCAPLTVNVAIRPPFICNGANPCDMDFESNNKFQALAFSHTYTQPGTYTLRILFQTSGFDQITIVVAPNTTPTFEIYACGGNAAQVNVTDTNYDQYVINYNDASPEVVVPSGSLAKDTHAFGSPGQKTVTVRGRNLGADDNCSASNQNVMAMVVIPPPFITRLQALDNTSLRLDFNAQQNVQYKLEIATNSTVFQQLRTIYNVTSENVTNLRTDDNYYCFRLGAFDPCNNITVYSNVICSSDLDAVAQSGLNRLTWKTSATGIGSYSISKTNGTPLVATPVQNSLDDSGIICGINYCYQLTSQYANGSESVSLEKCVTAFSTQVPSTIDNISSEVADNSLALRWIQDPLYNAATYSIIKAGTALGTSNTPEFTDPNYDADAQLCYTISYTDACGNVSLVSLPACPVYLTGNLQEDNTITLSWNAYSGWINGVDHYVVEKYNVQGQLLQSFNTTTTALVDIEEDPDNQTYVYRIVAFATEAGVSESISNEVIIKKSPNLFHPNAFTPNGDGLNDTFKVFGQYTSQVEFKIFNRWGELLFFTTDLNESWNGTSKGNAMPEGTYVFRAYLTDLTGETSERSGNILLLHKR
ncbi:MAG: gliding motility-associated C-terminal domain-containing protein [Chryseolinea sp.]